MRNPLTIAVGCLLLTHAAAGQTVDWSRLFRELSDPDPAISAAARDRSFHEIIPRLESETQPDLARDIVGIAPTFTGGAAAQIRLQASGLLTGLANRRSDSAYALRSAFPIFTSLYRDSDSRIRANAVLAVASLRPQVPDELLPGLIELVRDPDQQVSENATLGLVRASGQAELARATIASLLAAEQNSSTRLRTLQAIAQAQTAAPPLIEIMRTMLNGRERPLVLAVVRTLGFIGPPAAGARRDLETIAQRSNDPELAELAKQALSRVTPP